MHCAIQLEVNGAYLCLGCGFIVVVNGAYLGGLVGFYLGLRKLGGMRLVLMGQFIGQNEVWFLCVGVCVFSSKNRWFFGSGLVVKEW